MVLVGNKCDKNDKREVRSEEGYEASKRFGCIGYFETSANTGEKVNEAFFSVATKAFKTDEEQRSLAGQLEQESHSLSDTPPSALETSQKSKEFFNYLALHCSKQIHQFY